MSSQGENIEPKREQEYGSDLIVDMMRATGIKYAAINPGATFRGIHDSLVNYGGNERPELIQVCHEEIAVAIAHGYAKATGKPMAAICHNIVGLQHASMAIFNAWCDRVPVIVMGGTGPMDTTRRRPWIDWVHSALVQGQIVRDYVKWDDQPYSVQAVPDSFLRAYRLATTEPPGPVYLCYDADIQEQRLDEPIAIPDVERYIHPSRLAPEAAALDKAAALLVGAEHPAIIADLMGRDPATVPVLVQLAEALGAAVIDLEERFNFPSTHPLDLSDAREEMLRESDVVLVLEAQDAYGALRSPPTKKARNTQSYLRQGAKIITISLQELITRSWAADYEEIQPADVSILADTSLAVPALLHEVQRLLAGQVGGQSVRAARVEALTERHNSLRAEFRATAERRSAESPIAVPHLAATLWEEIQGEEWVLANGSLGGWARRLWNFDKPSQWIGTSAGGGLGYGAGAAIGAALAYRDTDVLCVNMQSDGDFLFTPSALWTAAFHKIPLLTIMVNNRSYYNDEMHQELMAVTRGRPVENKVIGIRMENPAVDFAMMARSQGLWAEGPVTDPSELRAVLRRAIDYVKRERLPALVDVVVAST